jgi:threonine dehydratase
MQISKKHLAIFVSAATFGSVVAGAALLLRTEVAQAQQSAFKVTGSLALPGLGASLSRMEDEEAGVVCYVAPSGFFSCLKK